MYHLLVIEAMHPGHVQDGEMGHCSVHAATATLAASNCKGEPRECAPQSFQVLTRDRNTVSLDHCALNNMPPWAPVRPNTVPLNNMPPEHHASGTLCGNLGTRYYRAGVRCDSPASDP